MKSWVGLALLTIGTSACADDGVATDDASSSSGAVDSTSESGDTTAQTSGEDESSTGSSSDSSTGSSGAEESSSSTSEVETTGTDGDSGSTGDSSSGSSESESGEESSTGDAVAVCPAGTLDSLPVVLSGSTLLQDDQFASACGGSGAPDAAFVLVAPSDGYYVFDSFGSSYDTVLYVLDGECFGSVLACNDDDDTLAPQSSVGVTLVEGQVVTVVLDSFSIDGGEYQLAATVYGGSCPDVALGGTVPQLVAGSTLGGDNTLTGTCGGSLGNDTSYAFTAPEAGIYTFEVVDADFQAVLYGQQSCGADELGCNASAEPRLSVPLQAGESTIVVVDGVEAAAGNYQLAVDAYACPEYEIDAVPTTITSSTAGGINNATSNCGGGSAPDEHYTFTAPSTGTYVFDTFGTTWDTVLAVYEGEVCGGAAIACNDQAGGGSQSQVIIDLVAGQTVTVAVDGWSLAEGEYTLNVGALAGECPNFELASEVPQTVDGDLALADNTRFAPCGTDGVDDAYSFVAPNDGVFVFQVSDDVAPPPAIYLYDGATCGGTAASCQAQSGVVSAALGEGEEVVVVVDGAPGAYTLDVSEDVCPDDDLGDAVPLVFQGDTTESTDTLTGTCGGSSASPDEAFTFTAPTDGVYVFDTFGSTWDTVLYLREGDNCGGAEIACNDQAGGGSQSMVSTSLAAGETVVVVVDGWFGSSGPFTLNVSTQTCPDGELDGPLPLSTSGTTAGATSTTSGTCGGGSAPDLSFVWTAPADGTYVMSTAGSAYDTVLYVTDGAVCGGPSLGCNDDTNGLQSQVSVALVEGQDVLVTVDGFGTASGNYSLSIAAQ